MGPTLTRDSAPLNPRRDEFEDVETEVPERHEGTYSDRTGRFRDGEYIPHDPPSPDSHLNPINYTRLYNIMTL